MIHRMRILRAARCIAHWRFTLPAMVLALGAARPADACGGFFCSTGPVDQQQESILFEVDEASTSVVVQVSYNGDPGDFSWVIPVAEVPELEVVPPLVLDILNAYTAPQIIPRPLSYENCDDNDFYPSSGFGCSDAALAPAPASDAGIAAPAEEERDVDVVELPRVGPYDDIVVVSSSDPQELIGWLNDNGYLITPAMEPLVVEYVSEGKMFLALKLAPDAGVKDIQPIKFTCPAENPTIPLRLTAVAAQPDMRVVVHIVGDERFRPLSYRDLTIDPDHLRTDLYGFRTNYDAVVAWQVDREGGHAFVTERAGPSMDVRERVAAVSAANEREEAAQAYVTSLLDRLPYLTRLYTRMSAIDMNEDPAFAPGGTGDDVDGVISLARRSPIDACVPESDPEPSCGFSYCGAGARCAVVESGEEGCVCPDGMVARMVLTPTAWNPVPTVACQDPVEDVIGVDERIGDPCAGFACGLGGTCVPVNGFPTCDCGENAAVADPTRPNGVRCAPAAEVHDVDRLYAEVPLVSLEDDTVRGAYRGPSCRSLALSPRAAGLIALGLLLWSLRPRRRRG